MQGLGAGKQEREKEKSPKARNPGADEKGKRNPQ